MNETTAIDRCRAYIHCHLQARKTGGLVSRTRRPPAVTISRLAGAGAHTVAEHLAEYLQKHRPGQHCPWTVFDRNLVEKVLEDHHLPRELARFMPEDSISAISDAMEELLGLHPPSWRLVQGMAETILHLAELGNVILVGRGANIITRRLENVFHVRLVGSLEKRVARVQQREGWSEAQAREYVEKEDTARKRFVRRYFKADIDDPLLYDLIVNTDRISAELAAELIGHAVLKLFPDSSE